MSLKQKILYDLESNRENVLSGQLIAEKYGVSRSAVWKAVNSLKEEGYEIFSSTNRGYCLAKTSDLLSTEGIKSCLCDEFKNLEIIALQTVDSTNNEAKRQLANGRKGDFLVVSGEQTGGRGRKDHSFFSPKTGAYMSLVVHPKTDFSDTVSITCAAAVAVARAVEELTSAKISIKWVNDIYKDGKKLAGILTEAVTGFEEGVVQSVIVGIGINVTSGEFPEELREKISFLDCPSITRNKIVAKICENLLRLSQNLADKSFFDDYRRHSLVLGKKITYEKNGNNISATAHSINDSGALEVITDDGAKELLHSGEISIML